MDQEENAASTDTSSRNNTSIKLRKAGRGADKENLFGKKFIEKVQSQIILKTMWNVMDYHLLNYFNNF